MTTNPDPARTRLLPCGDAALLVETVDTASAVEFAGRFDVLRTRPGSSGPLVHDIVTGERSVLVTASGPTALPNLRRVVIAMLETPGLANPSGPHPAAAAQPPIEIPVVYAGPDLDLVSAATSLTRDQVVAAHTGTDWTVGFTGFAPGFAYLVGGDPRLVVPRREEPRPRVATGSVALAGPYSGIYPTPSPGGWQIIGHTAMVLWDLERDPPALLRPGVRVRFVDVGAR